MLKNDPTDIYRLGIEMQYRSIRVTEHPDFGGVNRSAHMDGSKHYPIPGEAIDLNVMGASNAIEDRVFDNLALELDYRNFGVIWNRGQYDHHRHEHAEIIRHEREQYAGRYNVKDLRNLLTSRTPKLKVDGTMGAATNSQLQRWLNQSSVTGILNTATSKALQAFLNTESRGRVIVDGKVGPQTISALQTRLGIKATGKISDKGSPTIARMQYRLNELGHL